MYSLDYTLLSNRLRQFAEKLAALVAEKRRNVFALPYPKFWPPLRPRQHPPLHSQMRHLLGAEQRRQIRSAPPAVQQLQGVIRKLANEDLALDAVPEHILIEAKSHKCGSCCAKA